MKNSKIVTDKGIFNDLNAFINSRIEAGFSKTGGWENKEYKNMQDRLSIVMDKLSKILSKSLYSELNELINSTSSFESDAFYTQGFLDGINLHNNLEVLLDPDRVQQNVNDFDIALKSWYEKRDKPDDDFYRRVN